MSLFLGKRENGEELYFYKNIYMLERLSVDGILRALEEGDLLVDFDARTGHNHGTKFRLRQNKLYELYDLVTEI